MEARSTQFLQDLSSFLDTNPTAWHAVDNCAQRLEAQGFIEIKEGDSWSLQQGQRYYIKHHQSSICAFVLPTLSPKRVRLLASHTDSPSFKLKPQPEIRRNQALLFGVEVYGAPLLSSWLNRDLGLAGRIVYTTKDKQLQERLVRLEKHPLVIPQLAIHLDREVNEKGLLLNKQEHLNALAALEQDLPAKSSYLEMLLRDEIDFEQLVSFDLLLFPIEKARFIGYKQQFLSSYRIDSLASVHAALSALLDDPSPLDEDIKMTIFWDNEEVGSHTAQGAESPFFNQTLERLLLALGKSREDYFRVLSQSHCTSIDLAHSLHPNYADKHDAQHHPILGKGIVLKTNAQQRYASDAYSSLPIHILASRQGIPLQKFVSRNDMPCGSTIGPLQACISGIPTVDIGCGQLSMHSCRELMACQDHLYLFDLLKALLQTKEWPQINRNQSK